MDRRPTVLIADDEPFLVNALGRAAKAAGLAYVTDTSSVRVMELAKTYRPKVVILDIHQKIDGRDLLAKLKRDPETADITVVILTAVEDPTTRAMCAALGATEYYIKPHIGNFMERIAELCGVVPAPVPEPV